MVWDLDYIDPNGPPRPDTFSQRWSIVDPVAETMQNYDFLLPTGKGDLFCAGHAWTKDGKLFVVGGTESYPIAPSGFSGGNLTNLWDPQATGNASWNPQADSSVGRWYPTVTMDDNDKLIVSGGLHHQTSTASIFNNDYEAFRVDPNNALTGLWDTNGNVRAWQGPTAGSASTFATYPRFHLLSTGEIFMSGDGPDSAKIRHVPTNSTATPNPHWDYSVGNNPGGQHRHDGTSVLFPIELDPVLAGGTPKMDSSSVWVGRVAIRRSSRTAWSPVRPPGYRARCGTAPCP